MKKSLLLLLLLTASLSSIFGSELTVSMFDNSKIYVKFDGQRFSTYASSVTISSISPGSHRLEVFYYKTIRDYSNDFPTRAFSGYISISPNSSVFGMIDEYFSFKIIRTESNVGTPSNYNSYYNGYNNGYNNGYGNAYNSNNNAPDYWNNHDNYYNNGGGSYQSYGYSGYDNYNGSAVSVPNSYAYGMSLETFSALKATMMGTSFDSNRLNIAYNAIRMNGVFSGQLSELMLLLNFDSNRLDLAKFAYPFVVDKGNFFVVANAFNFSSSADELFEYVGAY